MRDFLNLYVIFVLVRLSVLASAGNSSLQAQDQHVSAYSDTSFSSPGNTHSDDGVDKMGGELVTTFSSERPQLNLYEDTPRSQMRSNRAASPRGRLPEKYLRRIDAKRKRIDRLVASGAAKSFKEALEQVDDKEQRRRKCVKSSLQAFRQRERERRIHHEQVVASFEQSARHLDSLQEDERTLYQEAKKALRAAEAKRQKYLKGQRLYNSLHRGKTLEEIVKLADGPDRQFAHHDDVMSSRLDANGKSWRQKIVENFAEQASQHPFRTSEGQEQEQASRSTPSEILGTSEDPPPPSDGLAVESASSAAPIVSSPIEMSLQQAWPSARKRKTLTANDNFVYRPKKHYDPRELARRERKARRDHARRKLTEEQEIAKMVENSKTLSPEAALAKLRQREQKERDKAIRNWRRHQADLKKAQEHFDEIDKEVESMGGSLMDLPPDMVEKYLAAREQLKALESKMLARRRNQRKYNYIKSGHSQQEAEALSQLPPVNKRKRIGLDGQPLDVSYGEETAAEAQLRLKWARAKIRQTRRRQKQVQGGESRNQIKGTVSQHAEIHQTAPRMNREALANRRRRIEQGQNSQSPAAQDQ